MHIHSFFFEAVAMKYALEFNQVAQRAAFHRAPMINSILPGNGQEAPNWLAGFT